jgi:hypothetical protein
VYPIAGTAHHIKLHDAEDRDIGRSGSALRRSLILPGHANRVRVIDRFFTYVKTKPGVWFARNDEIADWAMHPRQDPLSRSRSGSEDRPFGSVRAKFNLAHA